MPYQNGNMSFRNCSIQSKRDERRRYETLMKLFRQPLCGKGFCEHCCWLCYRLEKCSEKWPSSSYCPFSKRHTWCSITWDKLRAEVKKE